MSYTEIVMRGKKENRRIGVPIGKKEQELILKNFQ